MPVPSERPEHYVLQVPYERLEHFVMPGLCEQPELNEMQPEPYAGQELQERYVYSVLREELRPV